MKANELRIGNWVTLHGEECRVTAIPPSIQQEFRYEIVYNDGTLVDTMSHLEEDSIQPIPLTEEWLERFGLNRTNGHGWLKYGFNQDMLWFFIDIEKKRFQGKKIAVIAVYDDIELAICDIEYTHQLQNLYFALTGDELEIK